MTMARSAPSRTADTDDRDIVVTGSRRRPSPADRRGDWNACTIDDPKQDPAMCRKHAAGDARIAPMMTDGLSLAWQGETDAAIAAFDRAVALAPRDAAAYLNRGLAYRRKGDAGRAFNDLDQAVRLSPNGARYRYYRAILSRETGNARQADSDDARALELDPRYAAVVNPDG
jgi:tetratricopeptide (TPR) repeat protein